MKLLNFVQTNMIWLCMLEITSIVKNISEKVFK